MHTPNSALSNICFEWKLCDKHALFRGSTYVLLVCSVWVIPSSVIFPFSSFSSCCPFFDCTHSILNLDWMTSSLCSCVAFQLQWGESFLIKVEAHEYSDLDAVRVPLLGFLVFLPCRPLLVVFAMNWCRSQPSLFIAPALSFCLASSSLYSKPDVTRNFAGRTSFFIFAPIICAAISQLDCAWIVFICVSNAIFC